VALLEDRFPGLTLDRRVLTKTTLWGVMLSAAHSVISHILSAEIGGW
jgi:hypothetical protein